MPHFIDRLSNKAQEKRGPLRRTLQPEADPDDAAWQAPTQVHWHDLPHLPLLGSAYLYAVDGGSGVLPLVNASRLIVVQALAKSTNGYEMTLADVDVVP